MDAPHRIAGPVVAQLQELLALADLRDQLRPGGPMTASAVVTDRGDRMHRRQHQQRRGCRLRRDRVDEPERIGPQQSHGLEPDPATPRRHEAHRGLDHRRAGRSRHRRRRRRDAAAAIAHEQGDPARIADPAVEDVRRRDGGRAPELFAIREALDEFVEQQELAAARDVGGFESDAVRQRHARGRDIRQDTRDAHLRSPAPRRQPRADEQRGGEREDLEGRGAGRVDAEHAGREHDAADGAAGPGEAARRPARDAVRGGESAHRTPAAGRLWHEQL